MEHDKILRQYYGESTGEGTGIWYVVKQPDGFIYHISRKKYSENRNNKKYK